jgi:hypothetical protein
MRGLDYCLGHFLRGVVQFTARYQVCLVWWIMLMWISLMKRLILQKRDNRGNLVMRSWTLLRREILKLP